VGRKGADLEGRQLVAAAIRGLLLAVEGQRKVALAFHVHGGHRALQAQGAVQLVSLRTRIHRFRSFHGLAGLCRAAIAYIHHWVTLNVLSACVRGCLRRNLLPQVTSVWDQTLSFCRQSKKFKSQQYNSSRHFARDGRQPRYLKGVVPCEWQSGVIR